MRQSKRIKLRPKDIKALERLHGRYFSSRNWLARLPLLLASLFLSCCVKGERCTPLPSVFGVMRAFVPVWVDDSFTPEQKQDIQRAFATWNRALAARQEFVLASDRMLVLAGGLNEATRAALGWGVSVEAQDVTPEGDKGHLAIVRHESEVIVFRSNYSEERLDVVMLHEIGHVMGLNDNEPGCTLMSSPYGEHQRCVDSESLDAVAKRHHWNRNSLSVQCVR